MWRLALLLCLVACTTSDDTEAFGSAFAASLRSVAGCDGPTDNAEVCNASRIYGTPNQFCIGVYKESPWETNGDPFRAGHPRWRDVDYDRFRSACDTWREIGGLPIATARPAILELATAVEQSSK